MITNKGILECTKKNWKYAYNNKNELYMLVRLQYENKKSMWRRLKECGVGKGKGEGVSEKMKRERRVGGRKKREREVSRGQKARNETS